MNKYKQEIGIEIIVGLFMFTVLIALGVFTIVLSRENLLKKSYEYTFAFSEIGGLRDGDNIFVRGMNVGRVTQTELVDGQVMVYTSLDVPLTLREGFKVEVVSASMLGGKNLKIYEGPPSAPEISDQMTILGSPPVDLLSELGSAVRGIQEMMSTIGAGQGTLGKLLHDESVYRNLQSVSADMASISARLEKGEGTLGRLLSSDESLYNDLAETVALLRDVSAGLEAGDGTIGKLLKDEAVYDDLRGVMANLRSVSENLAAGKGMLGKLMSEDDTAYEDLRASLAAIRSISESIERGEGTIGKLIRDEQLYNEANLLMEDIRAAVDDLREASPITTFGSVMFGAF